MLRNTNVQQDNFTWDPESSTQKNRKLFNSGEQNSQPNLTKHQAKQWEKEYIKIYKNIKEPLPEAPQLNMPVDDASSANSQKH